MFNANSHLIRQSDIINYMVLDKPVVIVGAGATGSFTTFALSKMGVSNITVFDADVVAIENMNNQIYRKKDIGSSKVEALKAIIQDFAEIEITAIPALFDDTIPEEEMRRLLRGSYLICCADDMEVRKFCLEMASQHGAELLVDPRMGAEKYSQYAVLDPQTLSNTTGYRKSLHTNEEGVQTPCTAKSTIYTAFGAACLIVKTVKNVLMSEEYPKLIHWDVKLSQNAMVMFTDKKQTELVSEKEA